jgi:hypothetical protein
MTLRERRAWITFAAAALSGLTSRQQDWDVPERTKCAANYADHMLAELLQRSPEMETEPRSPNRKPRFRREARKAENEARRAASLGKASGVARTTGEA